MAEIEPNEDSNQCKGSNECGKAITERNASIMTSVDAESTVSAPTASQYGIEVQGIAFGCSECNAGDYKTSKKMGEMTKDTAEKMREMIKNRAEKFLKDVTCDVGEHGMRLAECGLPVLS